MKKFFAFCVMLLGMVFSLTANAQDAKAKYDSQAVFFAKGEFTNVALESNAAPKVKVSVSGEEANAGAYKEFQFASDKNLFNVNAEGSSELFVYQNNALVEGQLTLANNDVVKVYSYEPFATTVNFGFMNGPLADYANQVVVTMDKCVTVGDISSVNGILEGTEFSIKAAAGYEIEDVTYCNQTVTPVDGVYTFVVKETNPLANITMKTAKANAALYIKGSNLFTFSIQDINAEDPRKAEIYSETLANQDVDKYVPLAVGEGKSVRLVGQAKNNAIFVYLNGVQVQSTDANYFDANVNLAPSSVLKVYDAEPQNLTLNFGFMNAGPSRKWAAQVDVVKDVIIPIADITYPVTVNTGTAVSIKAKAGYEIVDVTYCNEPVVAVDGVYTFQVYNDNTLANITMKEAAKTAVAYLNGQFHTLSITDAAHEEALSVSSGTYNDYFPFAPGQYTLQTYNEANSFYVTLDGVAVENTVEDGQGFVAQIDVKDGSVLKVYNAQPTTSKVEFGFAYGESAKLADYVNIVMDKVVPVKATETIQALNGTEFQIKAVEGYEIEGVTVRNMPVYPNDGVYTVKINDAGDWLINIALKGFEPKNAYALVNGSFYTFTATPAGSESSRDQVLDVKYGEYNEYRTMEITPGTRYDLKGQNQNNQFFVYLNGEVVPSHGNPGETYEAQIELNENDVLKVYDAEPFTANVQIGFMGSREKEAKQVEVVVDGATPVDVSQDVVHTALKGTEFVIKAKEGYVIKTVYCCNEQVIPNYKNEFTVKVDREDMLVNIEMLDVRTTAHALVSGQFYTFTATVAGSESGRDQILQVENGTYAEYRDVKFEGAEVTVDLKGQNQGNTIVVYLDGVKVPSVGPENEMYEAQVTLKANSVLKVYGKEPYTTNMQIGFTNDRKLDYKKVEVVMDKVTTITTLDEDRTYEVLENTMFQVKPVIGNEILNVYYCNEPVVPVDGVYTFMADRQGDALAIIELKDTRDAAMAYVNGEVYTFTVTPKNSSSSRDQILDVTYGTYDEYRTMKFTAEQNPFVLKGNDNGNEFFVYLNGTRIPSTTAAGETYEAEITLNANDVLKIYTAEPYTSKVEFGFMQPRAEVAGQVEVVMDKVTPVDVTVDQPTYAFAGTEFTVKAKEGYEINQVIVNNEPVVPVAGVYTAKASSTGDTFIIIDMKDSRNTAVAYLNGTIYTANVTIAGAEDPRTSEILNVTYAEGYDEYRDMKFEQGVSNFIVKATTPDNNTFVYVDGEQVASTAEPGNTFEAPITLNNNSVLKIYDGEPFVSNVQIGFMGKREVDAPKVEVTMDKVTPVDVSKDVVYSVLEGTEFQITTKKGYGYEIKGVTVNNVPVYPVNEVYTVKAYQAGDMLVNIEMVSNVKKAQALVNGTFYTFTATAAGSESGRDQVLDVKYGEYNEYRTMEIVPGTRYDLKGQNENNTIVVYLNGVEVPSHGNPGEMYEAQIELNENDVLKVYDAEPFYTKMEVSFIQPRTYAANKVEVVIDHVKTVTADELENQVSSMFTVMKGTEFTIKAKEGYQIASVTYCNEPVYPNYNNVYTVKADRANDALIIIDMVDTRKEAVAYINGEVYTFTATPAGSAGNRDEILSVTYQGQPFDEYRTMLFEEGKNPFDLKGQGNGDLFVYLNGTKMESYGQPGELYQKQVNFAEGDVLKVYSQEPFWTNVYFDFVGDRATECQKVSVVMDQIVPVELEADVAHDVLQGTQFQIVANEGYVIKKVTAGNEVIIPVNGVYTFSANHEGELKAVIEMDTADGINNITTDGDSDDKIFNLQGVEVKKAVKGVYIVNGKKMMVK